MQVNEINSSSFINDIVKLNENFTPFKDIKIYGSPTDPLYNIRDISILLDKKGLIDTKDYTSKEIRTVIFDNQEINMLTKYGIIRSILESKSLVSDLLRNFIYVVFDKLLEENHVSIQTIRDELKLQNEYIAEIYDKYQEKITKHQRQLEEKNEIIKKITEQMNQIEAANDTFTNFCSTQYNTIVLLKHELEYLKGIKYNSEMLQQFIFNNLRENNMIKLYAMLMKPTDNYDYDISIYSIYNPPENDEIYLFELKTTSRECKDGQNVKVFYCESKNDISTIKEKMQSLIYKSSKQKTVYECTLNDIEHVIEETLMEKYFKIHTERQQKISILLDNFQTQ
jgi:hypothetical protein